MKTLLALVALTVTLAASAQEKILIGQSAPLTGPAAAAGTAFVGGARLYIDQVNRAGGIKGRLIELRTLDDMYVPERAAANARTLVDAGAISLFGFVNTPASVAGAQVAVENRVPFIAPATGVSSLRQPGNDYVFNVRSSFKDETSHIASHLQVLGIKRIGFFSLEIPESKVMFDHMGGLLGKSGQKFFAAVNQPPGKVDLKKAAEELKPKEVQAVVMFCPGKMCADLIGEIRKQGGSPTFYTISSAGDVFGELAAQGVSIAVTQVMPYPWTVGSFPIVGKYREAMKAANDTRIGYWSLEGYVSAQVLVEGLRRINGAPSRATMLAAMQNLGHLNLGGFDLTIDREDRGGSHFTDLTLARSGGKYIR
ncbi:branched-chain amino acid transport system substrate-binding protein [Variovorax boronicumulans]|uniref:ABC transporter substrate-binding protein n=1 Tax=Variovorax boronicumulans TaxID=436515 RepID=UPI0024752962|nr:ABC transporter substrate-binding protein [Variovorax boronicumulans]MDH6166443.1 branched-chain amino acid transport system substrate-binding protein [Variovorax boronicumulans]